MPRLDFPGGYNYFFLLDSSLIEFEYSNIKIEYSNLDWDLIEKNYCKTDESGNILFNVTNNIYIPFKKSEIMEYINSTRKILTVYADVKYKMPNEKIGAGIHIIYKDKL